MNKEYEQERVDLLTPGSKEEYKNIVIESLTIDILYTCTVSYLTAFINVRMWENLTDVSILPNKYKPQDVQSRNVDRKIKGPFMITISYKYRALPIIGTVPES